MKIYQVLILALLVAACGQNKEFTTPSGTKVTVLMRGTEELPVKDSVLLLYMTHTDSANNLLHESNAERPLALLFDPAMEAGELQEVLKMLKVGDSVSFDVTAANLYQETYKTELPPTLPADASINILLKLQDQMTEVGYGVYFQAMQRKRDSIVRAEDELYGAEQLQTEMDSLDAFLSERSITAQQSESGLRYVITQEGTGGYPKAGDMVTVHYKLSALTGEMMQSSYDRGEPFEFTLGVGQVIQGWDEGLGYIKKGGKATLYVPSPLAYGRGGRPGIPANSILVFDVEMVDFKSN